MALVLSAKRGPCQRSVDFGHGQMGMHRVRHGLADETVAARGSSPMSVV